MLFVSSIIQNITSINKLFLALLFLLKALHFYINSNLQVFLSVNKTSTSNNQSTWSRNFIDTRNYQLFSSDYQVFSCDCKNYISYNFRPTPLYQKITSKYADNLSSYQTFTCNNNLFMPTCVLFSSNCIAHTCNNISL
jgi:hypothetical protein